MVPGYDHRHPFPDYLLPQKGPVATEFNLIDSPEDISLMRHEQKLLAKKKKGNNKNVNGDNDSETASGRTNANTATSMMANTNSKISTRTKSTSSSTTNDDSSSASASARASASTGTNTSASSSSTSSSTTSSTSSHLTTLSITDDSNTDELIINPDEKETSDIIKSIRQLQTLLNDIANLFDSVEDFFYGIGSFSGDERKSTALYLLLLLGIFTLPIGVSFIPINFAFASMGWIGVGVLHPTIGKEVKRLKEEYLEVEEQVLEELFNDYEKYDIIIENNGPEDIRSVEIFELQRQGLTPRLWDPWVFTPIVYSERSIYRISEDRPPGCAFIESVLAPQGWYFDDEHPWILDEGTKSWVSHRGVLNVEIDVDEHWAYDYKDGQRGEWRRRRWIRECFRGAMNGRKKR